MPVRLTAKQIISVLKANGFELIGQKGSHQKGIIQIQEQRLLFPVMEIIK